MNPKDQSVMQRFLLEDARDAPLVLGVVGLHQSAKNLDSVIGKVSTCFDHGITGVKDHLVHVGSVFE